MDGLWATRWEPGSVHIPQTSPHIYGMHDQTELRRPIRSAQADGSHLCNQDVWIWRAHPYTHLWAMPYAPQYKQYDRSCMKKPSTGCNTPYQRRAWGWNVYQQTGLLTSLGASLGAFVGSAVGSWVGLLVGSYDEEKEVDTFCEPENSRICCRTRPGLCIRRTVWRT